MTRNDKTTNQQINTTANRDASNTVPTVVEA